MGPRGAVTDLLGQLLQVLYPGACLLCGEQLVGGLPDARFVPVCAGCRLLLRPLSAQRRCRVCSIPLVSEIAVCTRCRLRHFQFSSSYSVFPYAGAVRELIYQLKFANRRSLVPLFAATLENVVGSRFPGLPIVPAPGNPRTVRRRGWDPMLEVARRVSRRCGRRLLCLLRRRPGAAQKSLAYEERILNLLGTISLRHAPPAEVLLLDDVFTTGATADECARIIRAGGGRTVRVLTLAID